MGRGIGFLPQQNENTICYRNAKGYSVLLSLFISFKKELDIKQNKQI